MVSIDTAISIAFGLINTLISILGIFLAYLTLRAMIHEQQERKYQVAAEDSPVRHEHIHVVAPTYVRRPTSNRELRWRD